MNTFGFCIFRASGKLVAWKHAYFRLNLQWSLQPSTKAPFITEIEITGSFGCLLFYVSHVKFLPRFIGSY